MHEVPNLQLCSMRKCDLDIWQHTPRPHTGITLQHLSHPWPVWQRPRTAELFRHHGRDPKPYSLSFKATAKPCPMESGFHEPTGSSSFLRPELCDRFITEQQLLCLPPKFGTTLRTRYWSSKLLPVLDATVPAGSRAGTNSLLIWPEF